MLSLFVKHVSSFIYMPVNIPFPLLRNTEANTTELTLEMETQKCISLYTHSPNVSANRQPEEKYLYILAMTDT